MRLSVYWPPDDPCRIMETVLSDKQRPASSNRHITAEHTIRCDQPWLIAGYNDQP